MRLHRLPRKQELHQLLSLQRFSQRKTLWVCYLFSFNYVHLQCISSVNERVYSFPLQPGDAVTLHWSIHQYLLLFVCSVLYAIIVIGSSPSSSNGQYFSATGVSQCPNRKAYCSKSDGDDSGAQQKLYNIQSYSELTTTQMPTLSFYVPDAVPVAEPTVWKHWRQDFILLYDDDGDDDRWWWWRRCY